MASGLQGFRASGLQGDGRDSVLDSLRGLAIICVVIGHLPGWMESVNVFSDTGAFISRLMYSFHMPLFFLLSGYTEGMRTHSEGFSRHVLKNFMSLYVPCLFFSYLQAVLNFLVFSSSNSVNVHIPELRHFLMIPFSGFLNYWFLISLFFVKTIHNFFVCFLRNKYIHASFWIIIFIFAGLLDLSSSNLPSVIARIDLGLYFHAGYIISTGKYISREKSPGFLWGIALLFAGLVIFFAADFESEYKFLARASVASCISLSLLILFYALNVSNKFLSVCGLFSMVIYCIHNYAAMIFRIFYRSGNFHGLVFLPYAVCFVTALFVPLGVVWLYTNVKCLRWIEYIFYPVKLMRK